MDICVWSIYYCNCISLLQIRFCWQFTLLLDNNPFINYPKTKKLQIFISKSPPITWLKSRSDIPKGYVLSITTSNKKSCMDFKITHCPLVTLKSRIGHIVSTVFCIYFTFFTRIVMGAMHRIQ